MYAFRSFPLYFSRSFRRYECAVDDVARDDRFAGIAVTSCNENIIVTERKTITGKLRFPITTSPFYTYIIARSTLHPLFLFLFRPAVSIYRER